MAKTAVLGAVIASLIACGHPRTAEHAVETTTSERAVQHPAHAVTAPSESIEAFMTDHFLIATFVRNGVIRGNLNLIRGALDTLATHEYRTVAPGGWFRWIGEIQEVARVTAEVNTLESAASGVATIARICGDCHRSHGVPTSYTPIDFHPAGQAGTLQYRMSRHRWAADRMWEGLIGPSDESWNAGARELARVAAEPPVEAGSLPAAFARDLEQVQEIGQLAIEAETPEQRAGLYASFLSRCAGCHATQLHLQF
jgi:hypothetical protein